MKTNLYIFSTLILSIFAVSCEDYLEENAPTFIDSASFYQTKSDARTAADAAYEMLQDGGWNSAYGRWWPAVDIGTDDVASRHNGNNFLSFMNHTVNGDHAFFNSWNQYNVWWVGVGRCNDVLKYVPSIDMDETEKLAILGEAKTLRALYYFHLIRAYGDVPLVVNAITSKAEIDLPRTDVEIIYDQIIEDLKYGMENCADALHIGRATKWTAGVILADVYQTRAGTRRTSQGEFVTGSSENWALARDAAKEVIDNSPNSLNTEPIVNGANITPAYGVAWDDTYAFSQESLMELGAVTEEGFGSKLGRECASSNNGRLYYGPNWNDKPFLDSDGYDVSILNMRFPGTPPGVGTYIPTPDLYDAFEDGDERRDWSIMTKYITSTGIIYCIDPVFRKYVDIGYFLGDADSAFTRTNSNFILYRYADALLIYAEAANEAEGSPSTEAYAAINAIRNRAGLADLTPGLSQEQFREAVWNERRCEFNAECKRKWDLIRTNRLKTETAPDSGNMSIYWTPAQGATNTYTYINTAFGKTEWPDNEWLFPIPSGEINLNQKPGTEWVQNEGYLE